MSDPRSRHLPTMSAHPRRSGTPCLDFTWADLGHRTTVTALGPDAARFVDGFTTAAIGTLTVGSGTETFFPDARGWVLAMAVVLRIDDGLLIDAEPGLGTRLCDHLEHFHIRERLELVDASADWSSLLLFGPAAAGWLVGHGATDSSPLFGHRESMLGGVAVRLVRTDWWSDSGWLVRCQAHDRGRLVDWMRQQGAAEADAAAVETLRIERGTPHPCDLPEKTLPQELGRDARALSFTKGCYLGQETVARIDALGHVNRRLVAVAVEGDLRAGADVRGGGGESFGILTSACRSPRLGCGLGLGVLSTKAAGSAITVDGIAARIVEVPA